MIKRWINWPCHDCGAHEGQTHEIGCDMERCPVCCGQLITCNPKHFYDVQEGKLPQVPYILVPNHCGLCGLQWPEDFKVADKEWDKYVIPPLQKEMLCRDCYEALKALFPDGWRNAK